MTEQDQDHEFLPFDTHFKDVGDAEIVPPRWVIHEVLPVGLTFLGGPPKVSNKSTQALAMACTVIGWKNKLYPPYMRRVDNVGTALIFSAEADAGVVKHMITKDMITEGVQADGSMLVSEDSWAFRLDSKEGMDQLMYWLNHRLPRIVVIDPFRNFHKADEKDSGAIFDIIQPLRKWAVSNDAAVILVHHTNKLNPNEKRDYSEMDLRGTSAMFGAADGVLIVSPVDEHGHIVKVKATFKRGQGWERTLKLACYQHKDRPSSEVFDAVTEKVFEAYQAKCETMEEVAKQVGVNKARVVQCVDALVRNGLLQRDGRKVKVIK